MVAIAALRSGATYRQLLRTQLKGVPKSMIYRIRVKAERVNAREEKLEAGDEVRIPPVRVAEREEEAVSPHLQKVAALSEVIPEDDHILVLNKPSGTAGTRRQRPALEGLRALRPEARFLSWCIVYRDTSGVLLVASAARPARSGTERLSGAGARPVAVAYRPRC